MMKRIFIAIAGLFIVMLVVLAIVLRPMLSHQSPPGEAFLEAHPHRLSVLTWNTARMGGFAIIAENEASYMPEFLTL